MEFARYFVCVLSCDLFFFVKVILIYQRLESDSGLEIPGKLILSADLIDRHILNLGRPKLDGISMKI